MWKWSKVLFARHKYERQPWAYIVLGASDDAVSCAVMLEVLHSLANQSTPLLHGVIFLFNGAEENILQVQSSHQVVGFAG